MHQDPGKKELALKLGGRMMRYPQLAGCCHCFQARGYTARTQRKSVVRRDWLAWAVHCHRDPGSVSLQAGNKPVNLIPSSPLLFCWVPFTKPNWTRKGPRKRLRRTRKDPKVKQDIQLTSLGLQGSTGKSVAFAAQLLPATFSWYVYLTYLSNNFLL